MKFVLKLVRWMIMFQLQDAPVIAVNSKGMPIFRGNPKDVIPMEVAGKKFSFLVLTQDIHGREMTFDYQRLKWNRAGGHWESSAR